MQTYLPLDSFFKSRTARSTSDLLHDNKTNTNKATTAASTRFSAHCSHLGTRALPQQTIPLSYHHRHHLRQTISLFSQHCCHLSVSCPILIPIFPSSTAIHLAHRLPNPPFKQNYKGPQSLKPRWLQPPFSMAPNVRRLTKEIADIHADTVSNISIRMVEESLTNLEGSFLGPPGTPYEGGTYDIEVKIQDDYPFKPPKMRFITKVWHPNISSQTVSRVFPLSISWAS